MALILDGNGTVDTGTMVFGNGDITGLSAGALPSNVIGAGGILQVLSTTFSSTQAISTTSSTWTDISTLSVTITPTSSSSKFLILASVYADGSNNAYFRVLRDSTAIGIGDTAGGNYRVMMGNAFVGNWSGNANQFMGFSNFHLDSPATTSAITYKIQAIADGGAGSGTVYINYSNDETGPAGRPISNITVMEIAG
jgi:hypothetical protein